MTRSLLRCTNAASTSAAYDGEMESREMSGLGASAAPSSGIDCAGSMPSRRTDSAARSVRVRRATLTLGANAPARVELTSSSAMVARYVRPVLRVGSNDWPSSGMPVCRRAGEMRPRARSVRRRQVASSQDWSLMKMSRSCAKHAIRRCRRDPGWEDAAVGERSCVRRACRAHIGALTTECGVQPARRTPVGHHASAGRRRYRFDSFAATYRNDRAPPALSTPFSV